jgi:hypothetical protein
MYGVLNWVSVTSLVDKITQSNIDTLNKNPHLISGGFFIFVYIYMYEKITYINRVYINPNW